MRRIQILLFLLPVIFLSCRTYVTEITEKPQNFEGKNITLKGEISGAMTAPESGHTYYRLTDESGALWVNANKASLPIGETVTMKGFIQISVRVRKQSFPILFQMQEFEVVH